MKAKPADDLLARALAKALDDAQAARIAYEQALRRVESLRARMAERRQREASR